MLKLIFGSKKQAKAKPSNKPLRSNTYTADYGKKPFPNAYIQC